MTESTVQTQACVKGTPSPKAVWQQWTMESTSDQHRDFASFSGRVFERLLEES